MNVKRKNVTSPSPHLKVKESWESQICSKVWRAEWIPQQVRQACHPGVQFGAILRHNEAILNKGYFQHKVLNRSNTTRGFCRFQRRQNGKPCWWNTANRQMFLFAMRCAVHRVNLGDSSLVAGLSNEHLLGRPCGHYLCPCRCKKSLFPLWCRAWKENGLQWIAGHWRKRVWSPSGPIFLVLYNSFLCRCLTSIITMLPDLFIPPFLPCGSLFVKIKDANAVPMVCVSECVCLRVCMHVCVEHGHTCLGSVDWRLEFCSNTFTDSAQQSECCGVDRSRSRWELSYLSILQGGCDKWVTCQFRNRSRKNQGWVGRSYNLSSILGHLGEWKEVLWIITLGQHV